MSVHVIRVEPTRGMYRWVCSCGRVGKRRYGYVGLAESYGLAHAESQGGRA